MRLIRYCLPLLALALSPDARAGQLVLSPSSANFGNVQVADPPATRTVLIINHGSPTKIFGFAPGAGCTEFSVSAPGLPVTLHDPDTLTIQVHYDPANNGPDMCALVLQDDNGVSDILGMVGTGLAPTLLVPDTFLSFTQQAWTTATPETLLLVLLNQGNESIVAPHLLMALDAGVDFHLGAPPLPIAPNNYGYLPVIFHPGSPGPKVDHLRISLDNDSPSAPDLVLRLDGTWNSETGVGDPSATLRSLRVEPCPTRGTVHLAFMVPRAGRAHVEIRDLAGRIVARADRFAPGPGSQTVTLQDSEWSPAPGLYLVRVQLDGEVLSRGRVVVLR